MFLLCVAEYYNVVDVGLYETAVLEEQAIYELLGERRWILKAYKHYIADFKASRANYHYLVAMLPAY